MSARSAIPVVDEAPEVIDGYAPPPYVPPATLDERLVKLWREVTRTPGRSALAVLDAVAVIGLVASLRSIPVTAVDAGGALRANCGITYYVAGAANQAVDAACRYAFGSRIPQLILLLVVVAVTTVLLVRAIVRPVPERASAWRSLVDTPARAALAVFDGAALLVAVISLQPVTVTSADSSGTIVAHCGLGYFVFGGPVPAVDHACSSAYAPRAALFVCAVVLFVAGVGALVRLVRSDARAGRVAVPT